jgi:hypothetical protein
VQTQVQNITAAIVIPTFNFQTAMLAVPVLMQAPATDPNNQAAQDVAVAAATTTPVAQAAATPLPICQ